MVADLYQPSDTSGLLLLPSAILERPSAAGSSQNPFEIADWLHFSNGSAAGTDGFNSPSSSMRDGYGIREASTSTKGGEWRGGGEGDGFIFGEAESDHARGVASRRLLRPTTRASSRSLTRTSTYMSLSLDQRSHSFAPPVSAQHAAFNLLSLAQSSSGSVTGSFASSILLDEREGEFSPDEEETELTSDATSISSIPQERKLFPPFFDWNSLPPTVAAMTSDLLPPPVHPPSHFSRSRGNSITSSIGTTTSISTSRTRQHRPARTQRESRASSEATARWTKRDDEVSVSTSHGGIAPHSGRNDTASTSSMHLDSANTFLARRVNGDGATDDDWKCAISTKGKQPAQVRRHPKRSRSSSSTPAISKRSKTTTSKASVPVTYSAATLASTLSASRATRKTLVAASSTIANRTFPSNVEINSAFSRFYRRFPVSAAFPPGDPVITYANTLPASAAAAGGGSANLTTARASHPPRLTASIRSQFIPSPIGANWAQSPDPWNLYHHSIVRGSLNDKAAACPICIEPIARGGEGIEKYLKLKNSSYVYHLSNYHGISNQTGLPLSPPLRFRQVPAKKGAGTRTEMTEGLCHHCDKWIPLLSVKNVEAIIVELTWWKHAKPCHGTSRIAGETDVFIEDSIFELVSRAKA